MSKKITLMVLFLCVFIGLSTMADTVEKDKGYISVNSSATKEILPNQAEITISIETSDKSMQKAAEDNKLIANNVYKSLKLLLGSDDYIKTNAYTVKPVYVYTKDNKRVLDRYVVSNTVVVKTKKIDLVSKFIDIAISQGANNVNSLQFSAVDYDEVCNSTLADLTKKAYTQAGFVAKSINSQIIGLKSINAVCNLNNAPQPYFGMMAKTALDSASATPIEGGKITIYANIDASFYVK
ncbi:MAG: SIMPL domain-containing protein [Candidatus Gastranaerophilales bacterium]|nr:SIMPL domain-containing protein [Candidatus Gastranaerophilales bacterium]